MVEQEIREMLRDIVINNAEYECKPNFECNIEGCDICIHEDYCDWRPYKLGDEIHSDWKYRKIEKYYVVEFDDGHFQIENTSKYRDIVFEGTKADCEKWVDEHNKKTWIEERFPLAVGNLKTDIVNRDCIYGATEVCKKY